MNPTIEVNERISVVVIYKFTNKENSIAMPIKMRWKQNDIAFTKLGLRHPTSKGKRMIHVFDVSDGSNDYRIEHDAERLTWTLISMIPGEASYA